MPDVKYHYEDGQPYMVGYEFFSTPEEAYIRAGHLAFKYDSDAELVYKVVAKAVPKKLEPTYDIIEL